MTVDFLVTHEQEAADDGNPVDVVGDDGTVGGAVLPAEDGVEDTPAATTVEFWVAILVKALECVSCMYVYIYMER